MLRYRLVLITTFFWLIVLFNIERIDLFQRQPFNLDTAFYIFILLIVVILVTFPNLGKLNPVYSILTIFASYAVVGLLFRPDWISRWFIFPLMEFMALAVTFYLMRQVSAALQEFEVTVEAFILDAGSSRMLPLTEGTERINHELYLARRFERPISMVYCQVPPLKDDGRESTVVTEYIRWRITAAFKWRFRQTRLAKIISSITYKGDLIVEYDDGIVVCLPETSKPEAEMFANQLAQMVQTTFDDTPNIGIGTFPTDGLVFDDLAQTANNSQRQWVVDAPDPEDTAVRAGDVWVEMEQRLKISDQNSWINDLAYQSYTSRRIYMVFKRVMDVTLVLLSLPVVLPVGLILAFLIYREDKGTPFYIQDRTGYRGNRFRMYKFRSMVMDAEALPAEKVVLPDGSVRYIWPDKGEDDPRITKIGRILRKTSLDELPQLINVLKGDMSIVGPRPSSWDLNRYTLHQTERLTVRPGITGLWQVSARDSKNMDERLLWDLKYIDKVSLWMDIQIILRTVGQVMNKGGV